MRLETTVSNPEVMAVDQLAGYLGSAGETAVDGGHVLLTEWLRSSLSFTPKEWNNVNADYSFRKRLHTHCQTLLRDAYDGGERCALMQLHEALAFIYEQDFAMSGVERADCETQPVLRDIAATLERGMLEYECQAIPESALEGYPHEGLKYVDWLKRLISSHSSSVHPLYTRYIAQQASVEDLRFFLAQETNLDPRFDDILALVQVGLRGGEKLELANNYYDEMGNGKSEAVHSHLFSKTLEVLGVDEEYARSNMLVDARISGNISACLALSRRHFYKAIGYFGVTEYLAPRRFKHLVSAWRRNKLEEPGIAYHEAHIVIDAGHARGWFENVVAPGIERDPKIGREIALGACIRLNSSKRYLDALLAHFEPERAVKPEL